jgi:O-acetyl-ADP-ribose deacetylase (regulator of RNase III)
VTGRARPDGPAPEELATLEVAPGRRLSLVLGDITRVPADAIVNAANSFLAGGGGVDGAIHRAGGPAIMADLRERYGPDGRRRCPTGQAVVSVAGDLPARWVIHAVGPIWRDGAAGEPALLESAHRASFAHADALGAGTLAFPAISCGVYGYPVDAAAEVALSTVASDLTTSRAVERVTFVLFGASTGRVFARRLAGILPPR